MQLCPCIIKPPQTKKDWDKLWRLTHLLTQGICPGVSVLNLRRCVSFGYLQSSAKGDVQGQGVLGMLRRLWQSPEQLDPGGHVADSFQVGRAVAGLVARPLPVVYRLCMAAR